LNVKDANGETNAQRIIKQCEIIRFIEAAATPNNRMPSHGNPAPRDIIAYLDECAAILERYLKAGSFSAAFKAA
jgi:hypothetical protein